jgi:hypothetical protein
MNDSSGFVELTGSDIEMAIEALTDERLAAECRSGRGSPAQLEREEAYARWVGAWLRQFSRMRPGRVFFADADMHRLRGILFTCYKTQLSRRYRKAVLADDPVCAMMVPRLCAIEKFEVRMRNPEPSSGSVIGFDSVITAACASLSA